MGHCDIPLHVVQHCIRRMPHTCLTSELQVLQEDILPALEKLRKEKGQYMEWQAADAKLGHLKRFCAAYRYQEAQRSVSCKHNCITLHAWLHAHAVLAMSLQLMQHVYGCCQQSAFTVHVACAEHDYNAALEQCCRATVIMQTSFLLIYGATLSMVCANTVLRASDCM